MKFWWNSLLKKEKITFCLILLGILCMVGGIGTLAGQKKAQLAREAERQNQVAYDTEVEEETDDPALSLSQAEEIIAAGEYLEETESLEGTELLEAETQTEIEEDTEDELQEGEEGEESKADVPAVSASSSHPYYIRVNRQANCVTIYGIDANNQYTVPVKAMACSVGSRGNTPLGVYTTSDKYEWRKLFGGVYGHYAYRITDNILFHSVPYTAKQSDTLEYEEYNKLGTSASMGCIRLTVADAKWIYDNCPKGTQVEIYDSEDPGPLGKPTTIQIDGNSQAKGWDPTDPDGNNPWQYIGVLFSGVADQTVTAGTGFDPLAGVTAGDGLGASLAVTMDGTFDANVSGQYVVTFHAVNALGQEGTASEIITVVETTAPAN